MKIFYAWQGPNTGGRQLIQEALSAAAQREGAVVDQDTRQQLGAVDIPATLLRKIAQADMFVADVSLVYEQKFESDQKSSDRRSPNPNVLVELGYAARSLGWSRIITVMDSATGTQEDLPFDIRHRRVVQFAQNDRRANRENLMKLFIEAISATKAEPERPIASWETIAVETLTQAARDVATKAMTSVELARRDLGALSRGESLTYSAQADGVVDYFVGRFVRGDGAYASLVYDELVRRNPVSKTLSPLKLRTVDELEAFAHELQLLAYRLSGPALR